MHNLLASTVWDLLAESNIDQGLNCGYMCFSIAFVLSCSCHNKGKQYILFADLSLVGSAWCIPMVVSSFLHSIFVWEHDLK